MSPVSQRRRGTSTGLSNGVDAFDLYESSQALAHLGARA